MQGVGFARRPRAFQMEDKSSRHYQDRQECVILGTTHAYPAQVIQHTLWRMASAAKHVKHPPKHIRNHMQRIYKGLRKHANITLTCLHDCMSLYTYFRNHSSTTGTWPNFWQTVFNFWQLTHQGERSVAHCSLLSAVGLPHGCLVRRQEFTQRRRGDFLSPPAALRARVHAC